MTEIHTMRDLEYLEEQNRQLRESLKACKLEVNKLRAALREIAKYEPDEGCPCSACRHSAIARAALEGK